MLKIVVLRKNLIKFFVYGDFVGQSVIKQTIIIFISIIVKL